MHIRHIPELVEFHRKRVERLRHTDDLPAPWEVYPDIPKGSIGWRMGPGEDVSHDWFAWLRGLTAERREDYRKRHLEPESWAGTYDRFFELFGREPHGKNWDEYWDSEFQKQHEMYGDVA
jgi:hypothetical protein